MSLFSHFVAFFSGGIFAIISALILFYVILLKKIARNERYITQRTIETQEQLKAGEANKDARLSTTLASSEIHQNKQGQEPSTSIPTDKNSKKEERERKKREKEMIKNEKQKEKEEAKLQKEREKEQKEKELAMDPIHKVVQAKKEDRKSRRDSKGFNPNLLVEELNKELLRERSSTNSPPIPAETNSNVTPIVASSLVKPIDVVDDKILKSGWIKMRGSLNVWWKRWMVVKPGRILYYRKHRTEDLYGIIILEGCEVGIRVSKKTTEPSFKIVHPLGKNIYSSKGLKVEAVAASKMPGSTNSCYIKVSTSEERTNWIAAIQQAINSTDVSSSLNDTPTFGPTSSIITPSDQIEEYDISEGTATSDIVEEGEEEGFSDEEVSLTPEKTTDKSTSDNGTKSQETYQTIAESEQVLPAGSIPVIPTVETREDSSNGNKQQSSGKGSSTDTTPPSPKLEDRKVDVSPDSQRESPRNVSGEKTGSQPIVIDQPTRSVSLSSIDSTCDVTPQPSQPEEQQGWLELKTPKLWKDYFFLLRNGLLLYFSQEKSSDCDGLIDLDGCVLSQGSDAKTLVISHSTKKPILFIVNHPNEVKDDKGKEARMQESKLYDTCCVTLRSDSENDMNQWLKAIEGHLKLATAVPLILPRFKRTEGREEKCHWFNTFMSRYFKDLQHSEVVLFLCKRILARRFDRITKPDYIGALNIEHIDLGKEMIKIRDIFMEPTDVPNEVIGEADIYYKGGASLTLSTEFYVNFPKHHFAVVPVNVHVEVKHLSGRVRIYGPPDIFSLFSLSFLELPNCEFDVQLKVGKDNRYDLSKISKVSEFIESNLKRILWKNTVMPNRITFALPLPGKKIQIRTAQLTSKRRQRTSEESNQNPNNSSPPSTQPQQTSPSINS